MQNLINFLYRFRTFGFFILLEVVCFWLIVTYNNRPNAAFLNSSNSLIGSVNFLTNNTTDYFRLEEINEQLIHENRILREQLAKINRGNYYLKDSSGTDQYIFNEAKVINNTFRRSMNYLTLDAGLKDGVTPGMGVVNGTGVVGQVKAVSENYSTVISVLHRNLLISGTIKPANTLCTIQWDGETPLEAALKYVPRHIEIQEGDSVVTSGYNAIFPEGIFIGTIADFKLNSNDVFYDASIRLAVDFSALDYVFLISNRLKQEKDSLESESITQ